MSISITTIKARLDREDIDNRNVATSGTIASTGPAVTGTMTMFDTEAAVGDWLVILDANGDFLRDANDNWEARRITAIASATGATLESGFTVDASGDDYAILKFIQIPGVVDSTGPNNAGANIDNTTQDDGKYTSRTVGLIDTGQIDFNILFRPSLAGHSGLYDEVDGQRSGFLIKWFAESKTLPPPDSSVNGRWLAKGTFSQFGGSSPANDNEQVACSFLIEGKATLFAAGA